jgi:protoporphyrinogen oxidase
MRPKAIAVLGAGPMGLAAAYQLALDGHKPVIFEADNRVGGMAASFDFNGLQIERYYHFHCTSDSDLFVLLRELQLEHKLHWVATKMGYYFEGRLQRWGDPIALLSFRGLGLIDKLRYGLHAFLSTKRNDWTELDKMEATAWIKRWVGPRAFDVLWKNLFELKFYNLAYNLSAAWIWSRIRRVGRSRYSLFKEKLGYLDGGSDLVLHAMRAEIEKRGGEIRLSSPATRVVIENGAVQGVEAGGSFHPFDTVISTVPMPYVPRIMPDLPPDLLERYRAIQNIAVVCVIVKLRRPVTDNFWLNVNDPEMDIPGLVEYTNLRPLEQHVVYVPFYMPGEHPKYQDPDEVFLQKVKRYLLKINPTLTDADFLDMRASRYRHAQPVCTPGFAHRLPPIALPVRGLFVADTSFYYPEDRGISESVGLARKMARMATE